MRLYAVYENDELMFRGTAKEVGKKYYATTNAVYICAKRNQMLCNRYVVKENGEYIPPIEEVIKEKKQTKKEKEYEYLLWHLKVHGNVYFPKDPREYLRQLKEDGFDCDVIRYNAKTCARMDAGETARKIDYILQLK